MRSVPIFLGQPPHQGHGVLNDSIQILIPHVPLDKTSEGAILFGELPHPSMREPGENNHRDVWLVHEGN